MLFCHYCTLSEALKNPFELWAYFFLFPEASPCALEHPCRFSVIPVVNNIKDNGPPWGGCRSADEGGGGVLTISTSQSLRKKQALGDSADGARKTDPKQGRPSVCMCTRAKRS